MVSLKPGSATDLERKLSGELSVLHYCLCLGVNREGVIAELRHPLRDVAACPLVHLHRLNNLSSKEKIYIISRSIVHASPPNQTNFSVITGRNEVVAKVIFLHLFVILFTGGSASVHVGITTQPRTRQTPPQTRQTLPRTRHTPQPGRHPLGPGRPPWPGRHPPEPGRPPWDQADTPGTRQTPPQEADSSIRSTSSRYASYWNAFLFFNSCRQKLCQTIMHSSRMRTDCWSPCH